MRKIDTNVMRMPHSISVQDLLLEVDDSKNRFEALSSNVDDKVAIMTQKEVQEMREQVAQLEGRWTILRRKLHTSVEDIRRTVKRQEFFEQEYLKMCSMLQTLLRGTETTGLDQTDCDMAVDLNRIEVSAFLSSFYDLLTK